MARTRRNVLKVVSRKQLEHLETCGLMQRFLWLRAYRAARVWRVHNGRYHPRVYGSTAEAFDAILDLAFLSNREFEDLFVMIMTAIDGEPFQGYLHLTINHNRER